MTSFGVKVIRRLFGIAEHIAPRLVGRIAFEIFCRTPDPARMTPGERRAVERAAGLMDDARHHRFATRGGWMTVHEFGPHPVARTGGTVLMLHGWRSRTEFMKALIWGYREAGYRVVALDLPGHGASSGRRLTLASAVEAVASASGRFGPFDAIVGHSFGGAVAVNAVAGSIGGQAKVATSRLVLIAAPNSLPELFAAFGRFLNLGPRTQGALARQVERLTGTPLSAFVGSQQLAALPTPTLVIHAPDDREVPFADAERYASAGPHVEILRAAGLGHRRILSDAGVVDQALHFVARPLSLAS